MQREINAKMAFMRRAAEMAKAIGMVANQQRIKALLGAGVAQKSADGQV